MRLLRTRSRCNLAGVLQTALLFVYFVFLFKWMTTLPSMHIDCDVVLPTTDLYKTWIETSFRFNFYSAWRNMFLREEHVFFFLSSVVFPLLLSVCHKLFFFNRAHTHKRRGIDYNTRTRYFFDVSTTDDLVFRMHHSNSSSFAAVSVDAAAWCVYIC